MGYYNMYSPDEIANIRAEQMSDGMPSADEAKSMHRNHLREEGCEKCDEHDPDNLETRPILFPNCTAVQAPPRFEVILCDECFEERETLRERAYNKAVKMNERGQRPNKTKGEILAVTFFECEDWHFVRQPLMDDGHGQYAPHPYGEPETPIECRCGADIAEIARLSELAEEFEDEDESDE